MLRIFEYIKDTYFKDEKGEKNKRNNRICRIVFFSKNHEPQGDLDQDISDSIMKTSRHKKCGIKKVHPQAYNGPMISSFF